MNFENKTICSKCNGECCKNFPGIVHPKDVNENEIVDMLFSGNYAIDFWEGDPRNGFNTIDKGYFIRPKTKSRLDSLIDASWGGECVFFIDGKGCKLSEKQRPYQCRYLEPNIKRECKPHGISKREICVEWVEYHGLIEEIIDLIDF